MNGSSDAHLAGQLGVPHMVVHSPALTAPAILAALRDGRSWIAASPDVDVSLTAGSATIGDRLTTDQDPVPVRRQVSGVPSGEMTVHTAEGILHRGPTGVFEGRVDGSFVRAEVRFADGRMAALTNPIRLQRGQN